MGEADVKKMENLVEGVKIKKGTNVGVCGSYMTGKQHCTPSRELSLHAKKPEELIHIDMSEQITPTTVNGANYYGLFIDDAIRMTYIAPMKTNGSAEMLIHIKLFAKQLETELGAKIK